MTGEDRYQLPEAEKGKTDVESECFFFLVSLFSGSLLKPIFILVYLMPETGLFSNTSYRTLNILADK